MLADNKNDRLPASTGRAIHSDTATLNDIDLSEAISLLSQAGIEVSRGEKTSTLQQVIDGLCTLSSLDGLTGLANRRAFDDAIGREIDRSMRTGQIFGLLLIDIDHFKQINDRYGHPVGDHVLQVVARLIFDCLRSIDTVARCGGEEFAAILPGISEPLLRAIAERARATIECAQIEAMPGQPVKVTVSIGAACSRQHVLADAKAMIESVDRNLYTAKRLGRNRVCSDVALDAVLTQEERAHILRAFESLNMSL